MLNLFVEREKLLLHVEEKGEELLIVKVDGKDKRISLNERKLLKSLQMKNGSV